jgi:hypothetical protein
MAEPTPSAYWYDMLSTTLTNSDEPEGRANLLDAYEGSG